MSKPDSAISTEKQKADLQLDGTPAKEQIQGPCARLPQRGIRYQLQVQQNSSKIRHRAYMISRIRVGTVPQELMDTLSAGRQDNAGYMKRRLAVLYYYQHLAT